MATTAKPEPLIIHVHVRNVYGVQKIYPADPASKLFAEIAGHTTLTKHTIDRIKQLGYQIAVEQEAIDL